MPTVLNVKSGGVPVGAVYVGRAIRSSSIPEVRRGSKFGNPFTVWEYGRGAALEKYKAWLPLQKGLVEAARRELRGKDLVCWCAPESCHAEVLMELANKEDGLIRIGVIGTAGRSSPVLRRHWDHMPAALRRFIERAKRETGRSVKLISGGAAGGDHTAVQVARDMGLPIHLHLPAYSAVKCRNAMQYYHRGFSQEVYGDPGTSLQMIRRLSDAGCTTDYGPDYGWAAFKARNLVVARDSDWLIAFTFGTKGEPPSGGTGHTWKAWIDFASEGSSIRPVATHIIIKEG